MASRSGGKKWGKASYLLFLVPFIGLSVLPFFNRLEPRLFGLPFFWWYQFLWIPLSAGLTALVHLRSE